MKPVTEFKFACPVCHQHIVAGAEDSGREIECPTCFRHIMVPRTPSHATTKLILRGRQAGKPQTRMQPGSGHGGQAVQSEISMVKAAALVTLIVGTIALSVSGLARYHDHLQKAGINTSLAGSIIRAATRQNF